MAPDSEDDHVPRPISDECGTIAELPEHVRPWQAGAPMPPGLGRDPETHINERTAGEIGTLDEALTLARRLHEQGEARRGEP